MRYLFLLLISCTAFAQATPPPQVLASIKPLQLIAAAVTQEMSEPALLLPPGSSPHSHQLRPSERLQLSNAPLVLWIGPELEPHLANLLDSSTKVTASQLPGIHLSEFAEAAEGGEEHHHHHEGHAGHFDQHLWLDPDNAVHIAHALSLQLQQLDPGNQARYAQNARHFEQQVAHFKTQVPERYPHLQQHGFYVFHDAWGYLAEAFELNILGHITLSPERQPGARHLSELRQKFKSAAPLCLFSEPTMKPAYLDRVTQDLAIYHGEIDPMASQQALSAESYLNFLQQTLGAIDHCLAKIE